MNNKIILYKYICDCNGFIKKILPKYSKTNYGNISRTILNIENKSIKNLPIILLNTLSYLEKCSDFAYLNTLIQFFICLRLWCVSHLFFSLTSRNSCFENIIIFASII